MRKQGGCRKGRFDQFLVAQVHRQLATSHIGVMDDVGGSLPWGEMQTSVGRESATVGASVAASPPLSKQAS